MSDVVPLVRGSAMLTMESAFVRDFVDFSAAGEAAPFAAEPDSANMGRRKKSARTPQTPFEAPSVDN